MTDRTATIPEYYRPHVVSTTVYLVLQEGGSTGAHYPSLYTERAEAARAARSHRRASYRATEPLAVPCQLRDGVVFVAEADLMTLLAEVRGAEYR